METKEDEGGWLYYVIGDNVAGYKFEEKTTLRPEDPHSYSLPKLLKGKWLRRICPRWRRFVDEFRLTRSKSLEE